ncbi:hypothetical protein VTJ49DRAFT_3375 [Mycothermus thermophilus]|uniref:Uncharacterized protein n=1 Tax=Humicola insolens TaxID=85995 RepID=A0ABR3V7N8_HUMIN
MATTHLSKLMPLMAAATSLLGSPATAEPLSIHGGFGGYGDAFTGRIGPYDANTTEFEQAIAASNATGIFHIPGYDVSKPWPGEPMDGWTIHLAMLDFSIPTIRECIHGDCVTNAAVGHSTIIRAPDSLLKPGEEDGTKVVNAHPSWGMCIWDFGAPSHLTPDRFNNKDNRPLADDGSCVGFLSDACIAALERETRYSYSVASSANKFRARFPGQVTMCSRLRVPDECGEHGPGNAGVPVPSYGGVPVPFLNGSVTQSDGWMFDGDDRYHGVEDLGAYWDSSVVNYWVIVTAMVNATISPDGYVPATERGDPLARVHCAAPNRAGTGKGFTFSGTVPANAQNFMGAAGGEENAGEENGTGLVASPAKAWIWTVLVVLVGVWVC